VSEPAEPLPEPLFAAPVLDPLSPPRADLAAVPVRRVSEMPGLELSGPALSGALLSGAVLLEGAAPAAAAPELAISQPASPAPAAPGPAAPQLAAPQPAAPQLAAPQLAAPQLAAPQPAALKPAEGHPAGPVGTSTQARPHAGRVVSGRGVTGRGIVVLTLVLTGLVGLLEVAFAGHRGAAFAFVFVFASAVGALVVRRRDLPTAIVAPPLLYCVLIAALSIVDTHDQTGGFVTRKAIYIGNAFVTGAPTLWAGTAAAAAIVWYRHRAGRPPRS